MAKRTCPERGSTDNGLSRTQARGRGPNRRIVVGMSGGVDSIAAASLLVEAGYDVIGVTLELWQPPKEDQPPSKKWLQRSCCKVGLARHVAQQLGIRHIVRHATTNFLSRVVTPFIADYREGRTPNPCVRCNALVKFEELLAVADEVGASHIATGHYAQITYDAVQQRYQLRKGVDRSKDQSYFLYRLTQAQLSRTIFPLGTRSKAEVWSRVATFDLPAEELAESQEICFVTHGDYREFLRAADPSSEQSGEIVDHEGAVVGRHQGIALYTIGQRKGLGIATGQRRYVVGIEPQAQRVMIGPEAALYHQELRLADPHWVSVAPQTAPLRGRTKVRYRADEVDATLSSESGGLHIRFDQPQRAMAPGQSAVFYSDDMVIAGGTITKVAG